MGAFQLPSTPSVQFQRSLCSYMTGWIVEWMKHIYCLLTIPGPAGGQGLSSVVCPCLANISVFWYVVTSSERCSKVRRFGRPLQGITDKEIGEVFTFPLQLDQNGWAVGEIPFFFAILMSTHILLNISFTIIIKIRHILPINHCNFTK